MKRIELVQQRDLAEFKIAQMEARRTKGADQFVTAARLTARREELEVRRDTLRARIPEIEMAMELAHATRLVEARQNAKGLEFASLTTRSGNTFEKVKVIEVKDDGAKISHSSGFARLRVEDLDQPLGDLLGLDEDLEKLAVKHIEAGQSAYHREIDQALAADPLPTFPPVTPATPKVTVPMRRGNSSGYSNFGFSRSVGLGDSANPESRQTYRIWKNGRTHTYRYYNSSGW